MNDYKNFCEYSVRPQMSGKILFSRIALMIAYTLFVSVYLLFFWVLLRALALLILLPFLMFAIIKITWKYVDFEYEFSIEAGELTVSKIYGGASRRVKVRAYIPDMTMIAPRNDKTVHALGASDIMEIRDFSKSKDSEDAWICIYPDPKRGKKRALVIETNEEMRRIFRICNPSAAIASKGSI